MYNKKSYKYKKEQKNIISVLRRVKDLDFDIDPLVFKQLKKF